MLGVALACSTGCSREEEEPRWSETLLPRLSLRARVAQMVVAPAGGPAGAPPEQVLQWVRTDSIGGVRVEGGEALSVARSLAQVRSASAVPLLVAAELDGGVGALVPQATELPPARVLAALEDAELSREAGVRVAREARALGIDLGLLSLPDAEPYPSLALPLPASGEIRTQLAAMRSEGLLVGVRILPPSGVPADTLPAPRWDRARLEAVELPPVRAAIERGVDAAVLPALALPALTGDSTPLVLSRAVVAGLLRRDLGFGGLVVAEVGPGSPLARRFGEGEAAVRAVGAGADLLLGVADPPATIAAVVAAVRSGRIPAARVEQAARRILEAKERFVTGKRPATPPDSVPRLLGTAETREVARRAAERSLLVLGARPPALLRSCRAPLLVARPGEAAVLQRELAARRPGLWTVLVAPGASPDSVPAGLASQVRSADCLVIAEREPGRGSGLSELVRRAALLPDSAAAGGTAPDSAGARISPVPPAKPTVLVRLLTSPPPVLPTAASVVLAWGRGAEAQRVAARAVAGEVGEEAGAPASLRWPPAATLHAVEPAEVGMKEAELDRADAAIRAAVSGGVFPGAVLVVGRRSGVVRLRGYGRPGRPASGAADGDGTLYDIASLTKIVGTTAAVMALVDDGKLRLDAPVRGYLPGFTGRWKQRVTVRHLLTHTAGLPAGKWLYGSARSPEGALRQSLEAPLLRPPGERMEYSDFGFILLAEAAQRAAGEPLDRYLARRVYAPLGMSSTMYLPPRVFLRETAPTALDSERDYTLWGVVHDANAFRLGGVAGHAGLFSTARDLAVFAQTMLNGGSYGTRRVYSPETVRRFSQTRATPGRRALGWDTPALRSSAGSYFSPRSYGHTGFTGTSLWIDPERGVFVVLLANRTYDKASQKAMLEVRERVHDAVARSVADVTLRPRPGSPVAVEEARRAKLERERKARLERERARQRARERAQRGRRPGRRRG